VFLRDAERGREQGQGGGGGELRPAGLGEAQQGGQQPRDQQA
jgi:hypothetical protein